MNNFEPQTNEIDRRLYYQITGHKFDNDRDKTRKESFDTSDLSSDSEEDRGS